MERIADIGVFGGSGFYSFLEDIKEVQIDTPYGKPSDSLFVGKIGQHRVAFMPRHARNHSILPHQINYRANVWAMKEAGCKRVISPCAAGSLQKHVAPGHFVICDQFVDWTDGRKSTFFEGPIVTHPSPAETYCPELRDLAIIDMLASTGMRVGEMVLLNRADIDFNERECIVLGKGDKERPVYFDARTKIHLQNYLASRTDNNPALFVTLKAPFNRLKIGGIEARIRNLGRQLCVNKAHPHKFRRTLATTAIDKGMPIEQLQRLLGHKRIDTTLQYAMVKQSNVKIAHRKYIG